jgi:hypothetical protein
MVHWLILVAAASCLVMLVVVLLARNGWWRWRPHINEGILSTVERHKPVVAAHRGYGRLEINLRFHSFLSSKID